MYYSLYYTIFAFKKKVCTGETAVVLLLWPFLLLQQKNLAATLPADQNCSGWEMLPDALTELIRWF